MDDTDQSRASEAAATRKRRSSILKSQRPARTPFSELEFNVATPTDTAKSRRVSFSRRTGVAEFITNEATTTWKNFYEEHNKSLESSGNDSDAKAFRQPIGHLGKRVFDQQFEEVEAIDLIGTLNPSNSSNLSLSNINFTDQLASLDYMSHGKLPAPQINRELSILPDGPGHSKLFGNDFTVTGIGEMSGRISVNFSAIQQINEGDDLDEIERDLGRINKVACQGPKDHNVSEYIEIDLNMTQMKDDECDMSITDSIHNPKVEDVFKNCSIDTKNNGNKDWVADKENIAINPYVSPLETDNFAINDKPNQVLVFDGKRLTVEIDKPEKDYRKTLLPNATSVTPQRKTIILNVNDDLPNFPDNFNKKPEIQRRSNVLCDLTPISNEIPRDVIKSNDISHISLTQALTSNIVVTENCENIVSGEDINNISMTRALSGKIIIDNPDNHVVQQDSFDISITQALPTKIIQNDPETNKRKTIVFNEEDGNISMTNVISTNIILEQKPTEKRKTIIFNDDNANISITQAIPMNIIMTSQSKEKNETMIYEDSMGNMSVTQAVPHNIDLRKSELTEARKSNVYLDKERDIEHINKAGNEDLRNSNPDEYNAVKINMKQELKNDECDMSITDILPGPKIQDVIKIFSIDTKDSESNDCVNKENIVISPPVPSSQAHNVNEVLVFDDKMLALETIKTNEDKKKTLLPKEPPEGAQRKSTTNMFNIVDNLITKTEVEGRPNICNEIAAINNIIKEQPIKETNNDFNQILLKQENLISERDNSNISMTQALPGNIIIENNKSVERRQTVVKESDIYDISITQALPANILQNDNNENTNKRKTIIFNEDEGDISITNVVSTKLISEQLNKEKCKTVIFDTDNANISLTQAISANILLASQSEDKKRTTYEEITHNSSVTQAVPTNIVIDRRRTIVYEENSDDITLTQALPPNIILGQIENTENVNSVTKSNTQIIPDANAKSEQVKNIYVTSEIDSANIVSNNTFEKNIPNNCHAIIKNKPSDNVILHVKDSWEKANEFLLSGLSNVNDNQSGQNVEETIEKEISNLDLNIESGITDLPIESKSIVVMDIDNVEISQPGIIAIDEKVTKESVKNQILNNDMVNVSLTKPMPSNLNTLNDNDTNMTNKSENMKQHLSEKVVSNQKEVLLYQAMTTSSVQKPINVEQENLCHVMENTKYTPFDEINTDASEFEEQNDNIAPIKSDSETLKVTVENNDEMDVDNNIMNVVEHKTKSPTKICESIQSQALILDTILNTSSTSPSSKEILVKADNKLDLESFSMQRRLVEEFISGNISSEVQENEITLQTDEAEREKLIENILPQLTTTIPLPIEQKESDDLEILHNRLADVSNALKNVKCADHDETEITDNDDKNHENVPKTFENGNDTKALIDMISNITDDSRCEDESQCEIENHSENVASCIDKPVTDVKEKSFARISMPPNNRLSVPVSSRDMLNNISMAQAALQNTEFELEVSSQIEDTLDLSEGNTNVMKKSVRISSEVVKTLHFDDESISETSIKKSPLKKTAFGETSYMMESYPNPKKECNKANVIPTYDINDGIKELMSDLVKPMADILPYKMNIDHKANENVATTSKELQTDLATSSQIDMDIELSSNQPSNYEIRVIDSFGFQPTNQKYNIDSLRQHNSKDHKDVTVDTISNMHSNRHNIEIPKDASLFNRKVLVFDHQNPLNNILLRPVDDAEAHRYDPIKETVPQLLQSDDSSVSTCNQSCQINVDKDYENSVGVSTNIDDRLSEVEKDNISNSDDYSMSEKKPISRDCSVDAYIAQVQDTEVNTVIAMKANKDLLEATSSLTLVDEPTTRSIISSIECYDKKLKKSPLKVIFDIKDQESSSKFEQLGSDTLSQEETKTSRPKKRSHLITPVKTPCNNDTKPNMKIQKLSNSPKCIKSPEKHIETKVVSDHVDAERKKILKSKTKHDSSITVQHLITEYNLDKDSVSDNKCLKVSAKNRREIYQSKSELECNSSEVMSSCASSKNLKATDQSVYSASSSVRSSYLGNSDQSSRTNWHPVCRFNLPNDCDSGVNIVAKIDMLPFMGSPECEWDTSPTDTWCFLLLHRRIRLIIRLEHRHDNATRTRVRADTRVTDVNIDIVKQDKKNPMATVCVRFAAETFRYLASHRGNVREARDVPQLLRRGAALARTALRWARAMHDAKVKLAYTLDWTGHLALKVANIPLRSVWEVSMDLELVVEDARETPWPRACNVRVTRVVSDINISAGDIQRVICNTPKDWGHVPKTLWQIFRYLKNKTLEDEMLLSSQQF